MKSIIDRALTILLSFLLLMSQLGCSTTNKSDTQLQSSSQYENKDSRLRVAIVPSDVNPIIDCITFETRRARAAAKGAGDAANAVGEGMKRDMPGEVAGTALDAVLGEPEAVFLLPLLPILIPVIMVTGTGVAASAGAIHGAIKGDYTEFPMEEAEQIKKVVEHTYSMIDINGVFAKHLMEVGRELTDHNYSINNTNDLDNDIDIILKVGVSHLEFKGENEKDPDTRLKVKVGVELKEIKTAQRFSYNFKHISKKHDLSDWLENSGILMQKEYSKCHRSLSDRIIKKVFLSTDSDIVRLEKERQYLAYIQDLVVNTDFKTITILDKPYHLGDDTVKGFINPQPQGNIFEKELFIPDTNLHDISITIWVSKMWQESRTAKHPLLYYKNELFINNSKIAILNNHTKGMKDDFETYKITIGLKNYTVKSGYNVIKITAGSSSAGTFYDDFEVRGIILSYKNR